MRNHQQPFWKRKSLSEMSNEEWESLCDGCGKCCLLKLEDEDTGEIAFTDLACRLFDSTSCRCSDYPNRHQRVSDCILLTPEKITQLKWMPSTCAYRLLSEGKDLEWWHPLVSNDQNTVHEAGISVRNRTIPEREDYDLEEHIVTWVK
jgi:uncharacterized cysteine cluster protein YcgN (CxxCxxCC family)